MTIASQIADIVSRVLTELLQNINFENNREREKVLHEWVKEGSLQKATTSYVLSVHRRDELQREHNEVRDHIKKYIERHSNADKEGSGTTGLHQFVRIRHWGDLSIDPTLDLIKHRVLIEPNQYSSAPKILGKLEC